MSKHQLFQTIETLQNTLDQLKDQYDKLPDQKNTKEFPMQPIVFDETGVIRFKENRIVRTLLDTGKLDLNALSVIFRDSQYEDDWTQFYQLIGYSVSGYGELSKVDQEVVHQADMIAEKLSTERKK